MRKIIIEIDGKKYRPVPDGMSPGDNCYDCALKFACEGAICVSFGFLNYHFEPCNSVGEPRITVEVKGKKHELVKDKDHDGFYGCKQCSLRDECAPSDLICESLNKIDYHFIPCDDDTKIL